MVASRGRDRPGSAAGNTRGSIALSVSVQFEGVPEGERPPEVVAHAFDATGRFVSSAVLEAGKASVALPKEMAGKTVRVVFGPKVPARPQPKISQLARFQGYEQRLRLDPQNPTLQVKLLEPIWRCWLLCPCVVRGRLVKRLTLPDGTIKELPICHARVTICEVEPIPWIIARLPADVLARLRDELVAIVHPWPPPPPEDGILSRLGPIVPPGGGQGPSPSPVIRAASGGVGLEARRLSVSSALSVQSLSTEQVSGSTLEEARSAVLSVASVESTFEIRRALTVAVDLIRLYVCWWDWLWPFFGYTTDCVETVMVDESGRFETTLYYSCFLARPGLYFKAEQWQGLVWQTIYDPGVACNTVWDYACGSEITIDVTDPCAIPCAPPDPVDPPPGITTWVMPYAVGGSPIWGTPTPMTPVPTGWVRSDGLTDYGGLVNAPFGGYLGFRHGYSEDIPSVAVKYYRWSYRKVGAVEWHDMLDTVVRHYVKQVPGVLLPSFPAYILGPHTIGPSAGVFEFKPDVPPGPDLGDPPGTITYWPTDDFFGDIYSGYLNTPTLPGGVLSAAGQYQVKLEVFDPTGVLVPPGAGSFEFIVPSGTLSDGTVIARAAGPGEIDAGGFVFNLYVDNNSCTASIDAPSIGGAAVADVCGFLRYDPKSPTPVTIAFHARHPNGRAVFSFTMVRGAFTLPAGPTGPSAGGEVWAAGAGPYLGDGAGDFTHNFALAELLGTCIDAAFSENLYVSAKATTGWGLRITAYDAQFIRAFALAELK